jgi:hypothetical protein
MSQEQEKGKIDDFIGRDKEYNNLTEVIKVAHKFEEESYVLSLNSSFGNGKTTFLKLWQEYLEGTKNNDSKQKHEVFYLNIWKDDFLNNPLASLCCGLAELLVKNNEESKNLKEAFIKTASYALCAASQLLKLTTGLNAVELVKNVNEVSKKEKSIFEEFKGNKYLMENLRKALEKYVGYIADDKKPLFIFVDELDRTRPNYAVEFLEIIQHLFAVKGLVFVIAADKKYLQSALEPIYGRIISKDHEGYYRKFFTASYNLTSVFEGPEIVENFINKLYEQHLKQYENKICKDAFNHLPEIVNLAKEFRPKLRDIKLFFRDLSLFLHIGDGKRDPNNQYEVNSAIFLLSLSLLKKDGDLYHAFGQKNLTLREFSKKMDGISCFSSNDGKYRGIIFSCLQDNKNEKEDMDFLIELWEELAFLRREKIDKYEKSDRYDELISIREGCSSSCSGNYPESSMAKIYRKLEDKLPLID